MKKNRTLSFIIMAFTFFFVLGVSAFMNDTSVLATMKTVTLGKTVEDLDINTTSASYRLVIPRTGNYKVVCATNNCSGMWVVNNKTLERTDFFIGRRAGWQYAKEHTETLTVNLKKGTYTLYLENTYYGEEGGHIFTISDPNGRNFEIHTDKNVYILKKGQTYTIHCSVLENGKNSSAKPKYKTSNTAIAKSSSKGMIVAKNTGVCDLTITIDKNNQKKVKIVVLPGPIKNLKVSSVTKNRASISWSADKKSSGYIVELYDPDIKEYTVVKTVKSGKINKVTIPNLDSKTSYKIKVTSYVKAKGKKYKGNTSRAVSFKTI